jgi:hypothetical protein
VTTASAAEPFGAGKTKAVAVPAIRYDVLVPDDDDENADFKHSVIVATTRDGSTFSIPIPDALPQCTFVEHEGDLDDDGLPDALIAGGSCSSYVPTTYFFVAGTLDDRFVAQEVESGVDFRIETWRGRMTALLESNNEGYNQQRPESLMQRFAFERGRVVVLEQQRAVEVSALANLRSEDFDISNPDQEKVVWFDLDGDGKKDTLAGKLWARWGRIMWQVRFADGSVSDGGSGGCKRLGVLAEKTKGYRDLVCDFDTRIRWNGRAYK